jgi:hypothetical protein
MDVNREGHGLKTDSKLRVGRSGIAQISGFEVGALPLTVGFVIDGTVGGVGGFGVVAVVEAEVILDGHSFGRVDVIDPSHVDLLILGHVEHGSGTATDCPRLRAILVFPPADVATVEERSVFTCITGFPELNVDHVLIYVILEIIVGGELREGLCVEAHVVDEGEEIGGGAVLVDGAVDLEFILFDEDGCGGDGGRHGHVVGDNRENHSPASIGGELIAFWFIDH